MLIKNIILFVLLLTLIVSLHELGHLIAAKIFGVYCQEYSIGMGPKLWSYKGKETEYCLRAFPLGGFVAMAGDDDSALETSVDTSKIPYERTLKGIARWKRVIVMLAGIFMNMVLAVVIYAMLILYNGQYISASKPEIAYVQENSPAEAAGLREGDIVTSISYSGMTIKPDDYTQIISFTSGYKGEGPWTLVIDRQGETLNIEVYPEYREDDQRYMIGIAFDNVATELVDVNIFNCWYFGLKQVDFIIRLSWTSLVGMFSQGNIDGLSGPIGIYSTVSEVSSMGFYYYLQLIAMISISVGIMNALPLPIFDGGRVVLLLVEMILGHELSKKTENIVMTASLILLMGLLFLTTYNDVVKLIGG